MSPRETSLYGLAHLASAYATIEIVRVLSLTGPFAMVQSVCTATMKEKGECPNVPQPLKLTPIGLYSRHGQTPEEEGGVSFTDCTVIDHRLVAQTEPLLSD